MNKEFVYRCVIALATRLFESRGVMNCEELLEFVNLKYQGTHPYSGVRGVISAAHRRANANERKALESVFVDCNGSPLSWRF